VAVSTHESLPFQKVKTVAELDEQIRQSKDKYIMVKFYADWCVSCKEMERFTLSDAKVQSRLKDVVLLQIDVTEGTPDDAALLKRFKLFGHRVFCLSIVRVMTFRISKSLAFSTKMIF